MLFAFRLSRKRYALQHTTRGAFIPLVAAFLWLGIQRNNIVSAFSKSADVFPAVTDSIAGENK